MEIHIPLMHDSDNTINPNPAKVTEANGIIYFEVEWMSRTLGFKREDLEKICNFFFNGQVERMIPCTHLSKCKNGMHPASWG